MSRIPTSSRIPAKSSTSLSSKPPVLSSTSSVEVATNRNFLTSKSADGSDSIRDFVSNAAANSSGLRRPSEQSRLLTSTHRPSTVSSGPEKFDSSITRRTPANNTAASGPLRPTTSESDMNTLLLSRSSALLRPSVRSTANGASSRVSNLSSSVSNALNSLRDITDGAAIGKGVVSTRPTVSSRPALQTNQLGHSKEKVSIMGGRPTSNLESSSTLPTNSDAKEEPTTRKAYSEEELDLLPLTEYLSIKYSTGEISANAAEHFTSIKDMNKIELQRAIEQLCDTFLSKVNPLDDCKWDTLIEDAEYFEDGTTPYSVVREYHGLAFVDEMIAYFDMAYGDSLLTNPNFEAKYLTLQVH